MGYSAERRYHEDPLFHQLVDTIYGFYARLELTPSEVRDAAMLAAMKYERERVRHVFDHKVAQFSSPEVAGRILRELEEGER